MIRRFLVLTSLAFAAGCSCGPPEPALRVMVNVDPLQRATCVVLEVSDGSMVRATRELARNGKDVFTIGIKRDALPATLSLVARAYLSARGCDDPRGFNGESAVVSATFPKSGVDTVTLELGTPDTTADADGDGYVSVARGGRDCDDFHADVHPGATQLCSGNVDQDCDGAAGCNDTKCASTPACLRSPDRLAFVTSPLPVAAGACSAALTVETQDAMGAIAAGQLLLPVALTATAAIGVTFYSDAACSTAVTNVPIALGQTRASFYFKATTSFTASATVPGLTAAAQLQTVSAAAATRLTFSTPARTVAATQCSAALSVGLADSNNVAVAAAVDLTVAVTGAPATGLELFSDSACTTALSGGAFLVAPGSSSGTFFARSSAAGAIILTAASPGLTAAQQTFTVTPAAVAQVRFTSSPQGPAVSACSSPVVLTAQDGSGSAAPVAADTVASLTAAPAAGFTFYSDVNCTTAITQVTFTAGTSSATFRFVGTATGSVVMTAATASLGSDTQAAVIGAGAPAALIFFTTPQSVTAGSCSGAVTLQTRDSLGNPSNVRGSPLSIALAAAPATPLQFFSDASCSTVIAGTTIGVGFVSSSVFFKTTRAGAVQLSATSALPSAAQNETINPGPPVSIHFLGTAQTVTAGNCSGPLTLEVRDAFGNPATTATATTLNLSGAPAGVSFFTSATCSGTSTASMSLPANQSQVSFRAQATVAAAYALTGQASGLGSDSQGFTVTAAAAAVLSFTSAAVSVPANTCSTAVTVQQQDAFGNPVNVTVSTPVTLTDNGTGFDFHLAGNCGDAMASTAPIAAGTSSVTFFIQGSTAGAVTMTAAAASVSSGTQLATISSGPADHLAITTPARTIAAGGCSSPVRVQRRDVSNNPATGGGAIAINLSTTAASGMTFWTDAACTVSAGSTAQIAIGQSVVLVYLSALVAETVTLTAAATGLTAATQVFTTTAGTASQLVITSAPQTLPALDCSALATATLQDVGGNTMIAGSGIVVALSDGAGAPTVTFYSDAACTAAAATVNLAAGTSTATFYFKSDGIGLSDVSATGPSLIPGTQSETFSASTPTRLVFTTAAPTIEAGFCQPLTLERQDVAGQPTAPTYLTAVTSLTASPAPAAPLLATQLFSDSACLTLLVPPFNIAANSSSTVVYVKGRSGSLTGSTPGSQIYGLTAVAAGLTNGTRDVTVLPMVRRGACSLTNGGANPSSIVCPVVPELTSIDRTILVYAAGATERDRPDDDMVSCRLRLNASTLAEVVCDRLGTVNATTSLVVNLQTIDWQAVSFAYPASQGGVSVQHLSVNHSATIQNLTIPISSARASSFVLFSAIRPAAVGPLATPTVDVSVDGNDLFMAELTSPTNLQITFASNGTFATNGSSQTSFGVQVVNWSGANVVRALKTGGSTTSFPVAQATPNLARSILLYSSRMADIAGSADVNMCARRVSGVITDATTLTFQRGCAGTSPADDLGTISWERVELPTNVTVQRNGAAPLLGTIINGAVNGPVGFATAVDRTRAFAFTGGQGTGGMSGGRTGRLITDRIACSQANITFTSATSLLLSRFTNDDQGDFGLFVVEVTP